MENNQNTNQEQTDTQANPVSHKIVKNDFLSALTIWQWVSVASVVLGILLSFSPLYLLSDLLWVFGGMAFFLVSFLVKK